MISPGRERCWSYDYADVASLSFALHPPADLALPSNGNLRSARVNIYYLHFDLALEEEKGLRRGYKTQEKTVTTAVRKAEGGLGWVSEACRVM